MNFGNRRKTLAIFVLAIILAGPTIASGSELQASKSITSTGSINYWPSVSVTVDTSEIIGTNNLSVGFQLDWDRWISFIQSPTARSLAQDVGFNLVRVFDFRPTYMRLMPCTYWDESTGTGTWDWTNVDLLVQKIFEIEAEPFFCLGWARDNIQNYIPSGMAVNPSTSLPYPDSYAAYCVEWVKHFDALGLPVRYYEIMNEPWTYFGWDPEDTTKLAHYVELWNTVARAMRAENPNLLLSHDAITQERVLAYWLDHGDDVDFLDFHKYDAYITGQYSDEQMFNRAEIRGFQTVPWAPLGINAARQIWFDSRGKWLPAINSESNFGSAWESGTDPRIQQMAGGVWLALSLRMGILNGLNYNIYFEFASSKSWQEAHGTGWGFGMTNQDDNQPWFPYYVHRIIGGNLSVGDPIVEVSSSSDDVRTLAWTRNEKLNILLICKINEPRTIIWQGINGGITIYRIDNSTSAENPTIQTSTLSTDEPLIMNGYTVALVQLTIPT